MKLYSRGPTKSSSGNRFLVFSLSPSLETSREVSTIDDQLYRLSKIILPAIQLDSTAMNAVIIGSFDTRRIKRLSFCSSRANPATLNTGPTAKNYPGGIHPASHQTISVRTCSRLLFVDSGLGASFSFSVSVSCGAFPNSKYCQHNCGTDQGSIS